MPKKIDNPEMTGIYDSVTLIYHTYEGYDDHNLAVPKSHCYEYVVDEYSNPLEEPETLAQVETWFRNRYGKMLHCMVIAELGLHGEIYRWGNHGDWWEQVGETCGYA